MPGCGGPSNFLSQRAFRWRYNDGGLGTPGVDGGANYVADTNVDIFWEVAGEGYTGGVVRCILAIRQSGEFTRTFGVWRSRNGNTWVELTPSSTFTRHEIDANAIHYAHGDDVPWHISPLGGPPGDLQYVTDNNLGVLNQQFSNLCYFPGGTTPGGFDKEAELEFTIRITSGNNEDDVIEYRAQLSNSERFLICGVGQYFQRPGLIVRKQLIGHDMVQAAFQVRADDGPEYLPPAKGGEGYIADPNVSPTIKIGGEGYKGKTRNIRNRYLVQGNLRWEDESQLVERYSDDDGATWHDVPEGPQLVAPVERVPSLFLTQGDNIADGPARLGSGTFLVENAGQVVETKQAFHDYPLGAVETELEFCNAPVDSLIDGDVTIRFRLERVVPPTAESFNALTSYPLESYSSDLAITFSKQLAGALDEGIADLLQSKGLGTVGSPSAITGTAIVVGEEQESKRAQIAILPEGGRSDRVLGEFPKFQIFTSSLNYEEARALSESVHQALNQHQGALLGRPVARIQAEFEPIPLGRGTDGVQGGRHRFAQTFEVITRAFRPS